MTILMHSSWKSRFSEKKRFLIKFCIKLHNIRATNCIHTYILHDTNNYTNMIYQNEAKSFNFLTD